MTTQPEALRQAIERADQAQPVEFLVYGARFKLTFEDKGRVASMWPFTKELEGRWVALVAAEDDRHLALTAPPQRQPLTDEELDEMLGTGINGKVFKQIARAIEAAHGIKGEA